MVGTDDPNPEAVLLSDKLLPTGSVTSTNAELSVSPYQLSFSSDSLTSYVQQMLDAGAGGKQIT